MKSSAPLLHDTVFTGGVEPKPTTASNITNRTQYGHGDVEAGFKEADVVIERSFKTEQTHQGYIEPHACVASVNPDGTCEMWVCTQGHFVYRQQCAELLGLDVSKLRVTSSEIGGGFGGKTHIWAEPIALALSRKAGRPVKLVMSREEVFRASGPTSATSIDVKIGARNDGTITAASATLRYSCGPYTGPWAMLGAMTSFACYDLKNVKTVGYEVLVNRPKTAAYRAPSAPMAAFAVESVIDELAQKIGINPVEFRIKNAAKEGTKSSYGPVYGPIGIGPTLEAAQKHPHMKAPLGKNQGRGMACGFWFNFGGQTCTDLNVGCRRHRDADRRHGRRGRFARLAVAGGGGGARHPLCAGADGGRRYRNPGLQRHDRRKPRHLLLVDGDDLGRPQRHRGHAGTRGQDVGYSGRRCRLARTVTPGPTGRSTAISPRCRSRTSRRWPPRRADRSPATASWSPMAPASRLPPTSATLKWIRRPAPRRCCATRSCRTRERRCTRPMWRGSTKAEPRRASAGR